MNTLRFIKRTKTFVFFITLCFGDCLYGFSQTNKVLVSKKDCKLYILNHRQDTLRCFNCGVGLNTGNKQKKGDKRTPEGTFVISSIENSKKWTHDFNDGFGERKGAYGPWFVRLKVPKFKGIGIHGTCFPTSIGSRCSEGCIRLSNSDIEKLVKYIKKGCKVTILPDGIK